MHAAVLREVKAGFARFTITTLQCNSAYTPVTILYRCEGVRFRVEEQQFCSQNGRHKNACLYRKTGLEKSTNTKEQKVGIQVTQSVLKNYSVAQNIL